MNLCVFFSTTLESQEQQTKWINWRCVDATLRNSEQNKDLTRLRYYHNLNLVCKRYEGDRIHRGRILILLSLFQITGV